MDNENGNGLSGRTVTPGCVRYKVKRVELEFQPGTNIQSAAEAAAFHARLDGTQVEFTFNGVSLRVKAGSTALDCVAAYHRTLPHPTAKGDSE
jgi:hypothetical protein